MTASLLAVVDVEGFGSCAPDFSVRTLARTLLSGVNMWSTRVVCVSTYTNILLAYNMIHRTRTARNTHCVCAQYYMMNQRRMVTTVQYMRNSLSSPGIV